MVGVDREIKHKILNASYFEIKKIIHYKLFYRIEIYFSNKSCDVDNEHGFYEWLSKELKFNEKS